MSHIKIHKHHFYTLIFSCLLVCGVTIHATLANNLVTMGGSLNNNNLIAYEGTYSEEVEFTSANEYSDEIIEKKVIFKEKFNKLLEKQLTHLSDEKLEIIIERIETKIDSIKENDNISEIKSEKKLSQLLALLELLEEQLEYNEEFSLEIDLEAIFSV